MNRPTARVLTLLELLQSGGVRTAAELAERLGVDARTVRRYVDHLLDLDIPVESARGRYGGYRLARGYRLPPLMLLAVLLGLLAGRRSGLTAALGPAGETASAKIRRVLPARLADKLQGVLDTIAFTAGTDTSPTRAPLRRPPCCSPSPPPWPTAGRSPSPTPRATAPGPTGPCTRTPS